MRGGAPGGKRLSGTSPFLTTSGCKLGKEHRGGKRQRGAHCWRTHRLHRRYHPVTARLSVVTPISALDRSNRGVGCAGGALTLGHIHRPEQERTHCEEQNDRENRVPAGARDGDGSGENERPEDAGEFFEHTEEAEEFTRLVLRDHAGEQRT